MWRASGSLNVPGKLQVSKSLLRTLSSSNVTAKDQHVVKTPMSQPIDSGQQQAEELPPPPKRSGAGRMLKLAVGATIVGGATLLATSEDARLASIEYVPALETFYDVIGLSATKNKLPHPPNPSKFIQDPEDPENLGKSVSEFNPALRAKIPVPIYSSGITQKPSYPASSKTLPPSQSSGKPGAGSVSPKLLKKNQNQQLTTSRTPAADSKSPNDTDLVSKSTSRKSLVTELAEDSISMLTSGTTILGKTAQATSGAGDAHVDLVKEREDELERQKQLDMVKRARNTEIEQLLDKELSALENSAAGYVKINQRALQACARHCEELKQAMSADKESDAQEYWSKLREYRQHRDNLMKEAQAADDSAQNQVARLTVLISDAKTDVLTKDNPVLSTYESKMKKITSNLNESRTALSSSETMEQVMNYYFKVLHDNQGEFHKDIQEHFPDVSLGQEGSNLTNDELRSLLKHAHQRVIQLKQQLREYELFGEQRIMTKEEIDREYKTRLSNEMADELCRANTVKNVELEIQAHANKKKQNEELARQALAHSNHVNEMLKLQQSQLAEQHDQNLDKRIQHEKAVYIESLTKSIAKVDHLMSLLTERADVNKAVNSCQALMSYSQQLKNKLSQQDSTDGEDYSVVNLTELLTKLKEINEGSKFVETLMDSLPDVAKTRGVYTFSSLEHRFNHVFNECRKVAGSTTPSNIIMQAVSTVFSKLTLYSIKPKYTNEKDFDSVDGMDSKDLLIQAQYFVQNHCLSAAVKCMVQLEGLPRALAQEWIDEARLLLEARQIADALYSYALSTSMGLVI